MASEAGKGSAQRPRSIADEEWAARWDAIFGKEVKEDVAYDLSGHRNQSEARHDLAVCDEEGTGSKALEDS